MARANVGSKKNLDYLKIYKNNIVQILKTNKINRRETSFKLSKIFKWKKNDIF